MERFTSFVGIDVSKNTLDLFFIAGNERQHFKIENNKDSLAVFFKTEPFVQNVKLKKTLFCLENTGHYQNHLVGFLTAKKLAVSVQSPLHIKLSMGLVRGKTDKIDAERIAIFASKNPDLNLWEAPREIIAVLKRLLALRRKLKTMRLKLKTPIKEVEAFGSPALKKIEKDMCSLSLEAITADIKTIEKEINTLLKSDKVIQQQYKIVTSVKHIGFVIGAYLIVATNEFKNFEKATQFASYIGIAPFGLQSGTSLNMRPKIPRHGKTELKSLLHMAAVSAIGNTGFLHTYYDRKVAAGKHGFSVINAIKSKLLRQIFACVKGNRLAENR